MNNEKILFIALSTVVSGRCAVFNIRKIIMILPYEEGSRIFLEGDKDWNVQESPDKIARLIAEAKV